MASRKLVIVNPKLKNYTKDDDHNLEIQQKVHTRNKAKNAVGHADVMMKSNLVVSSTIPSAPTPTKHDIGADVLALVGNVLY